MNEKVKKIVKWIAVIAAAIGAAAAVIMEQGCTHKHFLKANGIKIDTIEVSTSTKPEEYTAKKIKARIEMIKRRLEEKANEQEAAPAQPPSVS